MPRYQVRISRHNGEHVGTEVVRAADASKAADIARELIPFSRYAVAIVTELSDGGQGDQ